MKVSSSELSGQKPAIEGEQARPALDVGLNNETLTRKPFPSNGRVVNSASSSISPCLGQVSVRFEEVVIPTFLPAAPDKNPMFLEKRVYQGSSGKIYPLPFTDRISEKPVERRWKVIWLENEFLRVMVLPELGGRIHSILDKTNGYELLYKQAVIKPALVGLAGPWISGGIEFNWPQHHRPATFLPVDFHVEEHKDGSKTVWCSDHDPICRMKGMHGVCLHPQCAWVELKVRAYNRTQFVQTFLWWANVATRVHEQYQSFFPPDVYYVADHARRSMSEYPQAEGFYYGVNYGERGRRGIPKGEIPRQFLPSHCLGKNGSWNVRYEPNDLSFYANIPVPTSYMCMGSQQDFFGGYDYAAEAGIVHIANHHISPGKKQWTWGNHEFGYAWDRNLTEPDEQRISWPYIEIMAGVYTDNQPDFSFLQPGETKSWSQYWYPIRKIGPAQHANLNAAVSLRQTSHKWHIGVSVTRTLQAARITLFAKGKPVLMETRAISPKEPFKTELELTPGTKETVLMLQVTDAKGCEVISYRPTPRVKGKVPAPATEPTPASEISSADELFITGLHLEQYRHATRCPTTYWKEALKRDPWDSRCNNAMGLWHTRRGEFVQAEPFFRRAIERLTRRNANPYDGEPYYNLGLCLRFQHRDEEAYAAFYKATWNQAWQAAGFHALAELDCKKCHWNSALEHLERALRLNSDNLRARNLKALVLRGLGRGVEADQVIADALALDPLDWWARRLGQQPISCNAQTRLDIVHDLARAGFYTEADSFLGDCSADNGDLPDQNWGAMPIVLYTRGWLHAQMGDQSGATISFKKAAQAPFEYCFPARLEEIEILETAIHWNKLDARAPYYLGNLLFDRRRHEEAIAHWKRAAKLDPAFSVVWRNLGIAHFNIGHQPALAKNAYERAFRANPDDARLLYERDQLWKRLGESPVNRLRELEKRPGLVQQRDDLSVELCALYNQTGQHERALELIGSRNFQPWEGGEGGPLGQHVRSHLALGRIALSQGNADKAREHFESALSAPQNLGEAKHLLANQSDIHYWLGCALSQSGEKAQAREQWQAAANFKGDFQEMSVRAFSEMTYYSALAWEKLGKKSKSQKLLRDLLAYASKLERADAKIDFFATSLPTMLLFEDDLKVRQQTSALFLQAQSWLGLGNKAKAKKLLGTVLRRDPNHALAADLSNAVS